MVNYHATGATSSMAARSLLRKALAVRAENGAALALLASAQYCPRCSVERVTQVSELPREGVWAAVPVNPRTDVYPSAG